VQVQGVAANGPFQAASAHDALLEQDRRKPALPEGGKGPNDVVAQDHNGLRQVDREAA
jgi:hypothetical protein